MKDIDLLLPPLPGPAEMSAWDKAAILLGLPEAMLMENASRAAFDVLQARMGSLAGARVLLFMGSGNNGGDAACLARHLLDAGAEPLVLHTRPLFTCGGASAEHVKIAEACGVVFLPAARLKTLSGWAEPDIVVDGLLGTGFSGMLNEQAKGLVERINTLGRRSFVLALDIPSGLDGLSGLPCPIAVKAGATVTFQAAKPGLMLPHASAHTGELFVRPIGIPLKIQQQLRPARRLLTIEGCAGLPFPAVEGGHKGAFGHVLVVGGSPGLTGAPNLAAQAALRCGAGLVTVAAPYDLARDIKAGNPNIMILGLGGGHDWADADPEPLMRLMPNCRAMVVGPGLGRGEYAAPLLRKVLSGEQRPPAVVDADALYFMPEAGIDLLGPDDVLTPHPGEAGRLLSLTAAQVQADRYRAASSLAAAYCPANVILKGAGTLLAGKKSAVCLAPYDVPQLSIAGSGDVLAGCVAALLAAGGSGFSAAAYGVVAHIMAGMDLADDFPWRGNTAEDIAARLPKALAGLRL